jgi:eukaryotic-like serine/threonine-protein kinase
VGTLQPTVVIEPDRRTPSQAADSRQSLPGELEEVVPYRGGTAALLFALVLAIMWIAQLAVGFLGRGAHPHHFPWATAAQRASVAELATYANDIAFGLGVAVGIATYVVSRKVALTSIGTQRLSQAFFLSSSAVIAFGESWGPVPPFLTGISWLAVWLIMYPLLVPAPPRRALVNGLVAASMLPLANAVAIAGFGDASGIAVVAPRVVGCYAAAGAGFIAARTIYNLGRKVESARRLGAYNLVEQLGQGGMGQVWRAEHRQLARPAAIKIIRPDHHGGDHADVLRRRFEREARATARLQSPHTIEVYDYGGMPDGSFYYVMELLDGIDLDSLIRLHGPQPAERVIHILLQACSSLEEAHACGLLHRDVKPANLFLCRKGVDLDVVKILDFGLVKSVEPRPGASTTFATKLTAEGMTSGTPAYMAPEAATGRKDVDTRSDLYSLGCVAYFLLTGQPVFVGTPMKVLLAHVHDVPQTPSERLATPIHEGLETIVMRLLAKQRTDRQASARELSDELRALVVDDPWTRERAEAWWDVYLPRGALRPLTESQPIGDPGHDESSTADTRPALDAAGAASQLSEERRSAGGRDG